MGRRKTSSVQIPRRLLAFGLIAVLAFATVGCWNPFAPPGGNDPPVNVSYRLRTSPDSVLYNLATAYEYKNLEEYLDCLAEDVTFWLAEDDVEPGEDPYWGKQVEEDIHDYMFDVVDRISLTLTNAVRETLQGPNPGDPVTYRHEENTDLRVTESIMTYFANAPQEFLFQIDPNEVGPQGQTLWEIIEWWDLAEEVDRSHDGPDEGERVSFGALKARYR